MNWRYDPKNAIVETSNVIMTGAAYPLYLDSEISERLTIESVCFEWLNPFKKKPKHFI
jgi:hypothetical protein